MDLTFLNQLGPWGVLAGAVLALVVPKLGPAAAAAVHAALALVAKLRSPATSPAPPEPKPNTSTPVLDSVVDLLKYIAAKRFPWLTPEAALVKYVGEQYQNEESNKQTATIAAAALNVQTAAANFLPRPDNVDVPI